MRCVNLQGTLHLIFLLVELQDFKKKELKDKKKNT